MRYLKLSRHCAIAVDIVTLGQYMRPTKNHLPVARWVTPELFAELRRKGLAMGFTEVAAGPLVRSAIELIRYLPVTI